MPISPAPLLLFSLAAMTLALIPGPATLYIVARGIHQGRMAGIVSAWGIASGNVVHITAAALGVSTLLLSSALAFSIVKYLGAAYLIYLGVQQLLDRSHHSTVQTPRPQSLKQIFAQGFVVNALNPKAALFFVAFLPQFIDPSRNVLMQVLFLGAVFTLVANAVDSSYALISGTLGGWLTRNRRFHKTQKYVAGGTYIGLGMATALTGSHSK
ncbi:LysE family translocator [Leptolyngbya ohadii]|uniref:LysE family translocator n=1 Tax=Leptolyngbya ohadii TaxID=1962290 RepID=UPI000B59908B|nr:LysE family translocator [Leptolyngbya ohadii]